MRTCARARRGGKEGKGRRFGATRQRQPLPQAASCAEVPDPLGDALERTAAKNHELRDRIKIIEPMHAATAPLSV